MARGRKTLAHDAPAKSSYRRLASASFADIVRSERGLPAEWLRVLSGIDAVRQFEELMLPCSVMSTTHGVSWYKIWHADRSILTHEVLYGKEAERSEYNARCLERVFRTKRIHVGTHGGLSDVFVPIVAGSSVIGALVSGPFATAAWSPNEIRTRFVELSGSGVPMGDAPLLCYARSVLDTPILTPELGRAVRQVLSALAAILGGRRSVAAERVRWHRANEQALHRRFHWITWRIAEALVDPVEQSAWSARHRIWDRAYRGLTRLPNLVLALTPTRDADSDALRTLVEDHAFVVACSEIALELDDTVCGKAGDSVAYLLTHRSDLVSERALSRLVSDVERRLRKQANGAFRIGISSTAEAPSALARCLQEALVAVDCAVHDGRKRVHYEEQLRERDRRGPIRFAARDALTNALETGAPREIALALERLIGDVVWRAHSNVARASAYCDVLYSSALDAVSSSGWLEPRSVREYGEDFRMACDEASSVRSVTALFRSHVERLAAARRAPRQTRRDTQLELATRYLERHLSGRVTLSQTARIAGYAPAYYSRLLLRSTGRTFEDHLLALRIERAKELLRNGGISVAQVASAAGFRSLAYFHRAFQREVGHSPGQYRQASVKSGS